MHINKVKYEKWVSFIYRHKSCYFDHRIEKESFQLENKPDNLTVHLHKISITQGKFNDSYQMSYLFCIISFTFFQLFSQNKRTIILFQKKEFHTNQMNSNWLMAVLTLNFFFFLKIHKKKSALTKNNIRRNK